MITSRDYWRVMNGGYLDNPHFSFCPLSVVKVGILEFSDSGVMG
jgi:hypothetical protein